MTNKKIKFFILFSAIFGGVLALVIFASTILAAELNLGLGEVETEIALPTADIRVVITRIINVALGFIGIVIVLLILYGGFLWMTSGGDEKKIETAKKVIFNAVIGLIIVILAFAISSFVLRRLEEATGSGGPLGAPRGGAPGGGGLPGGAFVVRGITPTGTVALRNITVRVVFSANVDSGSILGNVVVARVSDGVAVAGRLVGVSNIIEFFPDTPCPDENGDGIPDAPSCFDADTDYRVSVSTSIRDTGGRNLLCGGLAPTCAGAFRSGNIVDLTPPEVTITSPDDGASLSADSLVVLQAFGRDDSGVSYIEFGADGSAVGSSVPLGGYANSEWDTSGVATGNHILSARAFDFDGNSAPAPPISVAVRPAYCFNGILDALEDGIDCGASCGACAGGSCRVNSDCSSGVCRAGSCVDIPRIDFVGPPDGRPETLVTISGAFFGSSPGRVFFRSGSGEVAAEAAPCADWWSDYQIVVSVPAAAISGPLRVEAANGESDTTSDTRGSIIPDFIVNDVVRPGICRIVPTSSRPDQTFTLEGLGFGAALPESIVTFGNRSAATSIWSDQSITGSVPRLGAGRVSVQVVAGGVVSNPVYFNILSLSAGLTPFIASISPESGPRGEYVTLFGDNFGEGIGTVYFRNFRTNDEARGDVSFPASCSLNFWQNNSITVKVPARYADGTSEVTETIHNVRVVRSDGSTSNTVDFTVNSGTSNPGLCAINPNNGPVGTNVTLSGERFGAVTGDVVFSQNQRIDPPRGAWSDGEIRTTVPANAVTGPVRVSLGNQESNAVNFTVSNCNQTACTAGLVCCVNTGVCVGEGSPCASGAVEGGYGWRVSTGLIPTTPRVLEECRDGVSPSPSPWDGRRGGNAVCVNAAINVRFTTEMDSTSLVPGNILFERCTAAGADPCVSREPVFGRIDVSSSSFRFTPSVTLDVDSVYMVTLSTGVRATGLAGGNMEENVTRCGIGNAYCFRFRTRADASNCSVGSSVIDPPDYVSREMQDLNYNATALSADDICVALNSDAYNWTWSIRRENGDLANGLNPSAVVTNNDLVPTDGRTDAVQTVTTLLETVPNPSIYVRAAVDGRAGRGRLTIDFTDPEVVETWPNCANACVNAEVAVRFNTRMDAAGLSAERLMMRRCVNESCRTFDQEIAIIPSYDEQSRTVQLLHGALERSRYYRVFVSGDIRSSSGVNLTRLNYGEFYSWIFRTRDNSSLCEVASIRIDPASSRMTYLGERRELRSTPISPPDECNSAGQRLSPTDYSWSWEVSNRSVATLVSNGTIDVLPRSGTPGCSDICLHTGSDANLPVCGNSTLERGEDCDDGNTASGDGCNARCTNEGANAAYGSDCGDGLVGVGEDCDDGNTASGDGCSDLCENEGSTSGRSLCGNGDLGDGEDCDDGNTASGDGCSAECLHEGSVTGPVPVCGNSAIEAGEDCDDGNTRAGDGCSPRCLNEGRPACSGGLNNCCGNGITDSFEDFDDGNIASGDGYSSRCLAEGSRLSYGSICGNGASPVIRPPSPDLEAGEECEFTSRDSRIDPMQSAEAEGQGLTSVNSSILGSLGVSGIANLEVQCVCQNDLMCAGGGFPAGLGCGADHCCSTRPVVEVVAPPDGSLDACRNSLLTARFSTTMDVASFTAQTVWLDISPGVGGCQSGTLNNGWCEGAAELRLGSRTVIDASVSNATEKTILQFSSNSALRANKLYRGRLLGGANGVKSKNGVSMGTDYLWTFTTGADICSLDQAEVTPSPITFLSTNSSENPKQASAVALSLHNGVLVPIASVPGLYGWEWSWGNSDTSIVIIQSLAENQRDIQVVTAQPKNGQSILTATAEITSDTFFNPGTARHLDGANIISGHKVSDTILAIVNLCENPWPARGQLNWAPFIDEATNFSFNFSFYYCRDRGVSGAADDLPELGSTLVPAPPTPSILREYLFPAICPPDSLSCASGDALGLRIVTNGDHLAPLDWYKSQGFSAKGGSASSGGESAPSERMVDGYQGLEDGRTIYVNAANKIGDPIYTNIFALSYNENASGDVKDIRDQILVNWKFSINVGSPRICVDAGNSIILSEANRTPIPCTNDLDCRSVLGFCDAGADKLRRDTIRLGDARTLEMVLKNYSNTHKHCSRAISRACALDANCPRGESCLAEFPHLSAGTFIPSVSTSRWPSWQVGLGAELGIQLPVDPLNAYASCAAPGADSETCWNSVNQTYACGQFSQVYHYRNRGGTSYDLGVELEFGETPQASNPQLWFPSPMIKLDQALDYELRYDAWCQDPAVVLSASNLCGDGLVGPAEECESPKTDIRACLGEFGRSGWENLSCGRDCRWVSAGCLTGRCGDGIVQSPENCDDGARNGAYGHCNISCSGIGDRCGDSVRNGPEVCDEGANNGDYDGCAWDCRSNPGTFCGDRIRNGEEACDGEQGIISVIINGVTDICGIDNQTGYQTAHNCRSSGDAQGCGWSACVTIGLCGNGVKEGNEQCDDGNQNNSDGCLNTCLLARCGDGYTNAGVELCDAGTSNGVPCVPGYGISCTYCSNTCNPATVSGGSCGDGRVSGPEVCDGNIKANSVRLQSTESCHGNCLAICPPTYEERGISWSRPNAQGNPPPAASLTVASNEEVTMIIPRCNSASGDRRCLGGSNGGNRCTGDLLAICGKDDVRECERNHPGLVTYYQCPGGYCSGGQPITTDLEFTEAEPAPIDIVLVTDLSSSMTSPADCGDPENDGPDNRIECIRDALKKTIDSLFDAYPRGLMNIGLVSYFSANEPRIPYSPWVPAGDEQVTHYFSGNRVFQARLDTPPTCGEDGFCNDPIGHRQALKDAINAYTASGKTPTKLGIDLARCILNGSQETHHSDPVPGCPIQFTRSIDDLGNNIKVILHMSDGAPEPLNRGTCANAGQKTRNSCTTDAICLDTGICQGFATMICSGGSRYEQQCGSNGRQTSECPNQVGTCVDPLGYNPEQATTAAKESQTFTDQATNRQVIIPPAYVYSLFFGTNDTRKKDMIDWSSDCRSDLRQRSINTLPPYTLEDTNEDGVADWNLMQCGFDNLADHTDDTIHEEYAYWSSTDMNPLYESIIGSLSQIRVTLTLGDSSISTVVTPSGDRPLTVPRNFACTPNSGQEISGRLTYKGRGIMRVSDTKLIACYP